MEVENQQEFVILFIFMINVMQKITSLGIWYFRTNKNTSFFFSRTRNVHFQSKLNFLRNYKT